MVLKNFLKLCANFYTAQVSIIVYQQLMIQELIGVVSLLV